jgi:molecular chaperone GrpE
MNGIGFGRKEEKERQKDHKDSDMEKKQVKAEDHKVPDTKSPKEDRQVKAKKTEEITRQELLEKLKKTEEEAQKNHDLYMRAYAEMENVKKRGIKEKEELRKYANESFIKEILPVIDNLQKAISHAQNDKNPTGLIEGLELTLGGLITTLEKAGLKEVEAEGKPFDPNFHEAISQQGDDKVAPGHVITEIQKGYLLNGRLIRPSMVVVSQGNTNKREKTV